MISEVTLANTDATGKSTGKSDRKKSVFKIAGAFLLLGALAWVYFAPYLVLHSMKSALESKDATKLASHVNFLALKDNLKASFNNKIKAQVAQSKPGNPFASAGTAMATAAVSPMIESMVTPDNLAMLLQSAQAFKPTANAGKSNSEGNSKSQGKNIDNDVAHDISMAYEGFNRFAVTVKQKGAGDATAISLVLKREKLFSWRLADLRLPL
jgi:Ni,Fe-hydrogenase I large subunit